MTRRRIRTTPDRPVLTGAVLLRAPGVVQVGLDPPGVLIEDAAAESLVRLLRLVDGTRTRADLLGRTEHPERLDALLTRLEHVGQLASSAPAVRAGRVRLLGAGPLAGRIALGLVEAGMHDLVLYDDRPARTDGPTLAHALRARIHRADADVAVEVVNHWSKPERGADLTVLVGEALEVDRGITEALLRADQPHLVVRPAERGAVVGPTVRPGSSACLRCVDLARRDRDPRWPTLLPQLLERPVALDPAVLNWAAATAADQVLTLLAGADPPTLDATVELQAATHQAQFRSWPPHPNCGCRWAGTAEWGA